MEYISMQFKFHFTSRYKISGKMQNIINAPSVYSIQQASYYFKLLYKQRVCSSPCVHFVKLFQSYFPEKGVAANAIKRKNNYKNKSAGSSDAYQNIIMIYSWFSIKKPYTNIICNVKHMNTYYLFNTYLPSKT